MNSKWCYYFSMSIFNLSAQWSQLQFTPLGCFTSLLSHIVNPGVSEIWSLASLLPSPFCFLNLCSLFFCFVFVLVKILNRNAGITKMHIENSSREVVLLLPRLVHYKANRIFFHNNSHESKEMLSSHMENSDEIFESR